MESDLQLCLPMQAHLLEPRDVGVASLMVIGNVAGRVWSNQKHGKPLSLEQNKYCIESGHVMGQGTIRQCLRMPTSRVCCRPSSKLPLCTQGVRVGTYSNREAYLGLRTQILSG